MNFKANKNIIIALIAIVSFGLFSYTLNNTKKNKLLVQLVYQSLLYQHINKQDLNDDFSEDMLNLYLKRLDINKKFLLKEDIDRLSVYRDLLDDQIKSSSLEFFDKSVEIINQRIDEAEVIYKDILSKPFDLSVDDEIELDADELDFSSNKDELYKSWVKALKYQTITRLENMIETQEKAKEKNDTISIKSFEELEKDARSKVLKAQDNWFKRLREFDYNDRLNMYLNVETSLYDPHSSYLPPRAKEDFDISMSGQLEGIGATLQESDGYIKVTRIVPGSPSYKQGDLKADDLIIAVSQDGEDAVDIIDMPLSDAVRLIRGKKGTKVILTVKKVDGSQLDIPIVRDVIILEDTYAKSAIIQIEENKPKIGYIYLPKFYINFNDRKSPTCSDDVLREIKRLEGLGVKGLILDLRNNGGGSLSEVVKMGGFFIESGPIVQVKGKRDRPQILTDKDPSIQYKDPMIVLVNSFSASASEILAAALQDYKRAVIIGTNSTYGKGTVQRLINLDQVVSKDDKDLTPLGVMKITMQKFYRINGGATQKKGVIPDIILPDSYELIEIGEKELENVMPWDKIRSVSYDVWDEYKYEYSKLRKKSSKRVAENEIFDLISQRAVDVKNQREDTREPLNFEKYTLEQQQKETYNEKYDVMKDKSTDMIINDVFIVSNAEAQDSSAVARRDSWKKDLKKDFVLQEAMFVMKDILK